LIGSARIGPGGLRGGLVAWIRIRGRFAIWALRRWRRAAVGFASCQQKSESGRKGPFHG